jgi:hypothetical protein
MSGKNGWSGAQYGLIEAIDFLIDKIESGANVFNRYMKFILEFTTDIVVLSQHYKTLAN